MGLGLRTILKNRRQVSNWREHPFASELTRPERYAIVRLMYGDSAAYDGRFLIGRGQRSLQQLDLLSPTEGLTESGYLKGNVFASNDLAWMIEHWNDLTNAASDYNHRKLDRGGFQIV